VIKLITSFKNYVIAGEAHSQRSCPFT